MQEYDTNNAMLQKLLNAMHAVLELDHNIGGTPFRLLSEKLYRFTHGGSFTRVEPSGWVSTECDGLFRKDLVAEHKEPISQIFKSLQGKELTNQQLYEELAGRVKFVHITKKQDKALRDNKVSHRRPDPDLAYQQAGIQEVFVPAWKRSKKLFIPK